MKTAYVLLMLSLFTGVSMSYADANLNQVRYGTLKVEGLDIFYREAGDPGKPAVVLLHGFPTSSHMYREVLRELSDSYYLIAPDYPGFGDSSTPSPKEFAYTFDHLAQIMDKFLEAKKIRKYTLMIQDYGAPVGFRIATKHPERVTGLVIQNGNAYNEGLSESGWTLLRKYWKNKTPEVEHEIVTNVLSLERLKWQYTHGTRHPESILPDNWNLDFMKLNQPDHQRIALDLFFDYQNNLSLYPEWHKYLKAHQPPALIVWGKNDPFFPEPGAEAYKQDLKNIDYNILNTGHFALEEDSAFIVKKMRSFLKKFKLNEIQMRALILKEHGTDFVIQEIEIKSAGKGEVVVRIHASGINPLDLKIRAGKADHAKVKLPAILGMDLAGVIEEVGPEVIEFKVGDEVFGMVGGIGALQGTLAEYVTVDADFLARKSVKSSMRESAAAPLIFITAWEGLVDRAHVKSGQSVLVQGGAGGVGHMAVQIAKSFGANVYATGSESGQKYIESLGAVFINYKTTSVEEYMKAYTHGEGFDIVYDTVGGETLDASFAAAKIYTGHVVSCLGWGAHKLAPLSFRGATYSGVFTLLPIISGKHRKHHGNILKQASALFDSGKLKVLIDSNSFGLEDVNRAYDLIEAGKNQGKVVVEVS